MQGRLRLLVVLCASISLGACASSATVAPHDATPSSSSTLALQPDAAHLGPFLVAMNGRTGALEIWPLRHGGGSHPKAFSDPLGIGTVAGMATDGDVIAIATENPSQLVLYDVENRSIRRIADPFGAPTDVAIGKDGTIYVSDVPKTGASVTVYKPPSHRPVELTCGALTSGSYVAVDRENDIFIQGYGGRSSVAVAEIPAGSQNCTRLPVKEDGGYAAGIVVDPKTDDLVTLDDPSLCAGGVEGRMTVYPKPYDKATGRSRVLGFECASGLRLSADSKYVLFSDTNLQKQQIYQHTFPDGGDAGIYHAPSWAGFTTIPSSLPD